MFHIFKGLFDEDINCMCSRHVIDKFCLRSTNRIDSTTKITTAHEAKGRRNAEND
jgi:hypothetical protein